MAQTSSLLRVHYRDPKGGWEGICVIDSIVDGAAAGGVRLSKTVDVDEVAKLARAMTHKARILRLPLGGAKYGVRYDPSCPNKLDALTRFFAHIRPMCESVCGFGPDMNTSAHELDEVATRIGLPSRHIALAGGTKGKALLDNYHSVLGKRVGPLRVLDARTGIGVASAAHRAAEVMQLARPLRVAVQGFGQVGSGTAYFLQQWGHTIVAIADIGATYASSAGIEVESLLASRNGAGMIDPRRLPPGIEQRPTEAIFSTDCDVLVLAANSFAVGRHNVDAVRAKLVVEGGNLGVEPDAEQMLHSRGVPVVPDFLASGGAFAVAAGVIRLGWEVSDPDVLLARLKEHIGYLTEHSTRLALEQRLTCRQAALLDIESDEPSRGDIEPVAAPKNGAAVDRRSHGATESRAALHSPRR
jgi:glutamate dehydrogenase (NAD(P)+)